MDLYLYWKVFSNPVADVMVSAERFLFPSLPSEQLDGSTSSIKGVFSSRNKIFWMSYWMFRDVGRGFQILIKKLIT